MTPESAPSLPASPSPEPSAVQGGAVPVAAVPVAVSGTRVARELPEKRPLPRFALIAALAAAVAVPLLFLVTAVVFMLATNYNFLEWLE